MKATVESVEMVGTDDTPYGELNVFSYTFVGEQSHFSARHKNTKGFKVGSVVDFTPKFIDNEGVAVGSVTAFKENPIQAPVADLFGNPAQAQPMVVSELDKRVLSVELASGVPRPIDDSIDEVLMDAEKIFTWLTKTSIVLLLMVLTSCSSPKTLEQYSIFDEVPIEVLSKGYDNSGKYFKQYIEWFSTEVSNGIEPITKVKYGSILYKDLRAYNDYTETLNAKYDTDSMTEDELNNLGTFITDELSIKFPKIHEMLYLKEY